MSTSRETHHVVGVLGLDEGRKGVDPGLHGLVVSAGLTRLVQQVPGEDGGVLFVQLPIVRVAPIQEASLSTLHVVPSRRTRHQQACGKQNTAMPPSAFNQQACSRGDTATLISAIHQQHFILAMGATAAVHHVSHVQCLMPSSAATAGAGDLGQGRAPVDKGLDVVHVELLALAVGEEGVLVATSAPVHILQQPHRK